MLNESTITQARTAILSRNESVAKAFVERTEDGIFKAVGKLVSATALDDQQATWLGHECLVNSRMLNLSDVSAEYREYFSKCDI